MKRCFFNAKNGEISMNQNICNICGANYEYRNGRWKCPACGRRMTAKKLERIKMETMGREAYERRKKILTILFNVIWISAAAIWLYLQYKKTIG